MPQSLLAGTAVQSRLSCTPGRPGRMFPIPDPAEQDTMPQILKSAKNGMIEVKYHYTTGDIAHLMGVAHATAARMIDQGEIRGIWLPTKRRQRRITHGALSPSCGSTPISSTCSSDSTAMILVSISPRAEPSPPARPIGPAAPWGPEHPRSAKAVRSPRRHTTQRRK